MQQMIAHHENAVEMAKSLLKFADKDDMFHGPKSEKHRLRISRLPSSTHRAPRSARWFSV